MNDIRLQGPASVSSPPVRAGSAKPGVAGMGGDARASFPFGHRLTLSATRPTPAPFSWHRAMGHFWHGMGAEFKAMLLAPIQHPLATVATLGVSTLALLAAPMIGISAIAVGNAMLIAFGASALWRTGKASLAALTAYRQGDAPKAERDFEEIGAGSADLTATLGPTAAGKAVSIARRTEAGQALETVVKQSKVATAIKARFTLAPGQSPKLAALKARFQGMSAGERTRNTLSHLNEWRLGIAKSAPVRAINRIFDSMPKEAMDRVEGRTITAINYSKGAQHVRDWALAKSAAQRGQSVEEMQAAMAARLAIPKVLDRATDVAPTLARGPVPTSAQDFEFLVKQKHVKTIVSLLHPDNPNEVALLAQERQLAARYGVKLINLPLPFGVDPPADMVSRFLGAVDGATPDARVYVHCRLGRDRTGTMVAVFREARQGVSGQDALAEMKTFGFDPVRDNYLSYLANYVLKFAGQGLQDGRKLLLTGGPGSLWQAARETLGGWLSLTSRSS